MKKHDNQFFSNAESRYDSIFAIVPGELITDPQIDGFDFAVYCYTSICCYFSLTDTRYLTSAELYYQIWGTGGKPESQTSKITSIFTSLKKLVDLNYITLDPSSNRNNVFVMNIHQFLTHQNTKSQMVSLSELNKFKNEHGGFNLLKLYTIIKFLSNVKNDDTNDKWLTQCGQSYLCKIIGISSKTLGRRIQKLEEMKMLYVVRNIDQKTSNIYCVYDNRDGAVKYVKAKNMRSGMSANMRRSNMMKYNAYVERRVNYSDEELIDICASVIKNNKEVEWLKTNNPDALLSKKPRDVNVFPEYIIKEATTRI